ncbi:MAG: SMC-Scp complex subunit ScpB [Candidatus Dadabacteria bacterium]|nr:MAG: SMC-Scp complex subunit ScpB [Candidatus Dadabacteria bacterium]
MEERSVKGEVVLKANLEDGVKLHPLDKAVEALLFVSPSGVSKKRLSEILRCSEGDIEESLARIRERYNERESAIELVSVNESFQFRTRPEYAEYVLELRRAKPKRLSKAALETLAVVAYRQPVVKSEIEAIRGVDVTPTLKTLIDRRLVKIIGYKPTVGQPALYGTTDYFLEVFGLNSLKDLPALRDLRELEEDPGEAFESGKESRNNPIAL